MRQSTSPEVTRRVQPPHGWHGASTEIAWAKSGAPSRNELARIVNVGLGPLRSTQSLLYMGRLPEIRTFKQYRFSIGIEIP